MFALIGSFILSRTLVPTMARFLLKKHDLHADEQGTARSRNPFKRFQQGFEYYFAIARDRYRALLGFAIARPRPVMFGFFGIVAFSLCLIPLSRREFLSLGGLGPGSCCTCGAQPGTRIEETARLFENVEDTVRSVIPAKDLTNMVDNIGLPYSGINMAYQNTGTIGPGDGDALIGAQRGSCAHRHLHQEAAHHPAAEVPGHHVLLPARRHRLADIELRPAGADRPAGHRQQPTGQLRLRHRTAETHPRRAGHRGSAHPASVQLPAAQRQRGTARSPARVGLTQRDVANSLLVTLSGSGQVRPNFWLNP